MVGYGGVVFDGPNGNCVRCVSTGDVLRWPQ